jgi:formate-nitrite transporter family protein
MDELKEPSARERAKQDHADERAVDEAATLSPKLIYEVVRREGEAELRRPTQSLIWSGIAAGLLISFSLLGEAILRTHLPDTPSRYLIENMGYTLGFLLVILGRMQLFTENTITTVLPVMVEPSAAMFGRLARLWGIVLAANVVGAFGAACLFAFTPAIPPELLPAIAALSEHATGMSAGVGFARAIPAGILIAAIVWLMPQAESASFFVILTFSWLIAAGDFTHVVVGSVEMAFMLVTGALSIQDAIFRFFLPVLAGNIVGGTVVFALMVWGQVKDELEPKR